MPGINAPTPRPKKPTRIGSSSPAVSELRSACALASRSPIACACSITISPARVSRTGCEPPGRSISFCPTTRSSVAICWLMADCV